MNTTHFNVSSGNGGAGVQGIPSRVGDGHPQFSHFASLRDSYKLMFYGLANALSPENLAGDGEYTQAQVGVRKKRLTTEWVKLEKEIGFKISVDEAESWNPGNYK